MLWSCSSARTFLGNVSYSDTTSGSARYVWNQFRGSFAQFSLTTYFLEMFFTHMYSVKLFFILGPLSTLCISTNLFRKTILFLSFLHIMTWMLHVNFRRVVRVRTVAHQRFVCDLVSDPKDAIFLSLPEDWHGPNRSPRTFSNVWFIDSKILDLLFSSMVAGYYGW